MTRTEIINNILIFKNLLKRDLIVIKKDFFGDLINIVTWPLSLSITFGYILPAFGMKQDYGSFLLVGALASTLFYLAIGLASELVNDFESMRCIDTQLTIPLSSYKILLFQRVTTFALHSMALSIPLLPMGKFLLGDRFSLANFALGKFFLVMLVSGIFYGFFALMLAGLINNTRSLSNVWRRIYTPMQLLGCYWFSYKMAQQVFYWLSILTLFNPLTYMTEGVRCAVFGQSEYMNFWLSMTILIIQTVLLGWYSFYLLRKRLDLL